LAGADPEAGADPDEAGAAEADPKEVKKDFKSAPFKALAKMLAQIGSTSLTLAAVRMAVSFSAFFNY